MNKTEERLNRWCVGEEIDFANAQAETEYKKRARRVADSILLRSPDRVPVELAFGVFPALANGYTAEDRAQCPKIPLPVCFHPPSQRGRQLHVSGTVQNILLADIEKGYGGSDERRPDSGSFF